MTSLECAHARHAAILASGGIPVWVTDRSTLPVRNGWTARLYTTPPGTCPDYVLVAATEEALLAMLALCTPSPLGIAA